MTTGNREYDLEERLITFAIMITEVAEALPRTRTGNHIAGQIIRCGTSPAPNYGEAQSAESRRDFVHKIKICLKELRETRVWLLMILRKAIPRARPKVELARPECEELIRIFAKSVATAETRQTS